MAGTVRVILGSHNHIPYGADHEDFEEAYTKTIKPFVTTLYRFPGIPASLHYSGTLLSWIERNHPEFIMLLDDLITRKQIELIGGGFYEPMMPLLSLSDKIGQIEMLTTYIRKQFGRKPLGCWIPGLGWDNALAAPLNTAGMNYVFAEEKLFKDAGLKDFFGPCICEDQGKLITLFPLSLRLSRSFSEMETGAALTQLSKELSKSQGGLVSVFPEGFYRSAPGESNEFALQCFFETLNSWQERIVFTTPGRSLKNSEPSKKAFFPATTEKNFLIQYPEANNVYSKMIYTGVLINQLRGDKSRKRTAREELWKAQGADLFCHSGNGGLYSSGVRKAVYRSLIGAERITREKGAFIPSLLAFDFDLDGEKEFLFQGRNVNGYVKARGASLFELDYLPKTWNYLDTLSRRREDSVEENTVLDTSRRSAFMDRLISPEATLKDVLEGNFGPSRFCAGENYELLSMHRVKLEAAFRLPPGKGPYGAVEIEKIYRLTKDVFSVDYTLTNTGGHTENFVFIPSIDLSLPGEDTNLQRIYTLRQGAKDAVSLDAADIQQAGSLEIQDLKNEAVIYLGSESPCDYWIFPIRTRSRIRGTIRDCYQSSCFMPRKPLVLESGASCTTQFTLRIHH
ncbi:MAG: DUF1926 domain-containing protein [Spirochaetaceae bacterium]|jgi:hypothetical protein|nr:DUF1926 domain-containing protein [Spirochaetaceae bacterium]